MVSDISDKKQTQTPRFTPGFDILVGFLVTLRVISMAIGQEQDTTTVLLTTFVLFYITGLLFSSKNSTDMLLRGTYILLPLALIAGAQAITNATPIYILLVLFAFLGCGGGLLTRYLWQHSGGQKTVFFIIALLALTLGLNGMMVPAILQKMITIEEMTTIHDFEVSIDDSTTITSREMRGAVTVLVFWNTWCQPCLDQLPEIEKVHAIYATNPEVHFWAVNTNWRGDSRKKVDDFVRNSSFELPLVYDSGARITETMGVGAVPHVVLIDRQGRLRYRLVGSPGEGGVLEDALLEYIAKLLAEPAAPDAQGRR